MEYTIPLRKGYHKVPRYRRSRKAIDVLRTYLLRHTKADEVKLGQHLNEYVWAHGIKNPPARVTVTASVEEVDGVKVAKAELVGKSYKDSVRPEERAEEESGLKGKLQQMTQGKAPEDSSEAPEVKDAEPKAEPPAKAAAKKAPAETEEKSEAPKKAAKKAPSKAAKKSSN